MQTKDEILKNIFSIIDEGKLHKAIIRNPIKKTNDKFKKIDIRKIKNNNKIYFQICYYIENKVVHKNIENEKKLVEKILFLMEENFKYCEIMANKNFTILMNKDKMFKITGVKNGEIKEITGHNKEKNYILKDGEYVEWLYELNMMNKNGEIFSHMQKKFRQINKFLEILKDVSDKLENGANIIDMGCGKSYLSFAMYHYFNNIENKNVTICGYDLKKDVVENCNKLAEKFRFSGLKFFNEDIKNIDKKNKINMIVSLHACDTATDYAIYFGVYHKCDIILSVPCCQNEIYTQIKNETLASMLNYGILKERFSAILTDSIRADTLKLCGYKTSIIEFIETEHTPKNIMIKAVKNTKNIKNTKKYDDYKKVLDKFFLKPTIYKLLQQYIEENCIK